MVVKGILQHFVCIEILRKLFCLGIWYKKKYLKIIIKSFKQFIKILPLEPLKCYCTFLKYL